MFHICPRSCSRLATAAIFISVGVVQFIVGIILLKSKYVFLLSGPDFWTSASNLAVGSLLGISSTVWKLNWKSRSTKHSVKRKLLNALFVSAIIVNATTTGILILGEKNTLLSIQLEKNGRRSSTTFTAELLAYAYAASVCSPVVCIIAAIIAVVGNCLHSFHKKSDETSSSSRKISKELSNLYDWVYTPDTSKSVKRIRDLMPSEISSASTDNDSPAERIPAAAVLFQRRAQSVEELNSTLRPLSHEQDRVLSDGNIARPPLIPRCKDPGLINRQASYRKVNDLPTAGNSDGKKTNHDSTFAKSFHKCRRKLIKQHLPTIQDLHLPLKGLNLFKTRHKVNEESSSSVHKSNLFSDSHYHSDFCVNKNDPVRFRTFLTPEQASPKSVSQSEKELEGKSTPKIKCVSIKATTLVLKDSNENALSNAIVHDKVNLDGNESLLINKSKEILMTLKQDHHNHNPELLCQNETEQNPDHFKEQSFDDSDLEADSTFDTSSDSTPSFAGEVIEIRVNSAPPNPKLTPVPAPVVPEMHEVVVRNWRKALNEATEYGTVESNVQKATPMNKFEDGGTAICNLFQGHMRRKPRMKHSNDPPMPIYSSASISGTSAGGTSADTCLSLVSDCHSPLNGIPALTDEIYQNISAQDSVCSKNLTQAPKERCQQSFASKCVNTPKPASIASPRNILKRLRAIQRKMAASKNGMI